MQTIIMPANTFLFRAATKLLKIPKKCIDTDKHGIYFGTYPLLAFGIFFERNNNIMEFGIFITTEPIVLYIGKYSFRNINPSRYFDKKGNFIPGISLGPNENINHFDSDALPIIDDPSYNDRLISNKLNEYDGEIFIANENDINKIRLIDAYSCDSASIFKIVKNANFAIDAIRYKYELDSTCRKININWNEQVGGKTCSKKKISKKKIKQSKKKSKKK